MSDDTEKQLIYSANDIAILLNLKISTIRKYANVLQKAGYHFYKNEKGHRGYYDNDVIVLKKLIEIKSHPDMTLEQAANAVVSWVNQSSVSGSDTSDNMNKKRYISYDEFREFQNKQEEQMQQVINLNKELINRLDKQQEHLDHHLKQRDQELINVMNQTLETRKLIAAAQEEEEAKKGFFKKLFSKKN
ncbi:hypothetical protein [Virgibacillus salexigens]|uniref:hypothetical protein n=1 Tax=Virgibacillus massiliensis TaxID=1462526 RepID=UPI00136ADA59|nr:hypothetical protein [Virgibacillus massiliensis]MYL43907.1 hypothetical protein [Virgibacillus massiliensis]